jgi:hypothetical protein
MPSLAPCYCAAESLPKQAVHPVGAEAEACGPPPSPPEVSSKPRENGADNFPGFWRPPAAGSAEAGLADAAVAAAGAPASTSQRQAKRQELEQGDCGGQETPRHATAPGRERRVSPAVASPCLPKHAFINNVESGSLCAMLSSHQTDSKPRAASSLASCCPICRCASACQKQRRNLPMRVRSRPRA